MKAKAADNPSVADKTKTESPRKKTGNPKPVAKQPPKRHRDEVTVAVFHDDECDIGDSDKA